MRLSALERLQRDAHAGNVAAVADYVRPRIDLLEGQRDNLMAMVRERDAFISTVLDRMDASAAGGAKGGRKSIKPPGADDLISRMVRDNHALGGRRRKSAQLLDQYIANALNDLRSNTNTPRTGDNLRHPPASARLAAGSCETRGCHERRSET